MTGLVRQTILLASLSLVWGCSTLTGQSSGTDSASASGVESSVKPSTSEVIRKYDEEHPAEVSDTVVEAPSPEAEPAKIPEIETETAISPRMLYQLMLAEIAFQRGQVDVAISNYVDAAQKTQDPKVAERATQMAVYAQELDSAITAASLWVEVAPENPEAHRTYAAILLKIGRATDAIEQYEMMMALMPNESAKAYSVIVSQLSREQDQSVALAVMEKLIEKNPDDYQALFAYSHLAMRHAKFDVALTTLDQVLELKPNWSKAVILRARILAMQGEQQQALDYLSGVMQDGLENDLEVGLTYARMLTEARQLDEALVQFVRLAELAESNSEIHYFAGVLALQLRKTDIAEKHLNKVLRLGKQRIYEAHYYLGQVAELGGNYKEAIDRYSLVKRGELYFNAQIRVVALLADEDEFESARDHIQAIRVGNEKQQVQLYLLEGDVLREAKKYEDAKHFYTEILNRWPDETSIRYARALIAEKLGELELVEKDLLTILEVEPENAQVLNALGYTLADRTNRYQEALNYIKKAYELEPEDAAVMDSMGWVKYRLGEYEAALRHLRRANELAKDPEIAAHLGEVLWVTGNKSDALKIWEQSLEENPDHEVLMRVMKRFGL